MILRHKEGPPYRCFLPDLAGFKGFFCTGPGPLTNYRIYCRTTIVGATPCGCPSSGQARRPAPTLVWRRGWDLNPRSPCEDNGFRDRPNRPLSHLSTQLAGTDTSIKYASKTYFGTLNDRLTEIKLFGNGVFTKLSYPKGLKLGYTKI